MLKDSTRLIDTVARSGGQEFGVLLPQIDGNGAFLLAEKILSRMRGSMLGSPQGLTDPQGWRNFPVMRQTRQSSSRSPIQRCTRQRNSVGTEP